MDISCSTHFFTPFCLPMWNSGITHSVPRCVHRSQFGAPSSRLHFILDFLQFKHAERVRNVKVKRSAHACLFAVHASSPRLAQLLCMQRLLYALVNWLRECCVTEVAVTDVCGCF
jgi:hypothetical protein